MTKEELLMLKIHTRIKYIGKEQRVLDQITKDGPACTATKGLVIYRVRDHTNSSWEPEKELCIEPYSGRQFANVKPEDWEVVDAKRIDLARKQEQRSVEYARHWVQRDLNEVANRIENIVGLKRSIDRALEDVPLSAKLDILKNLSEDQKLWLQLISHDADTIKTVLKKVANDPDFVQGVVDGSNGSDVCVSAETVVSPS